MKRYIKFFQTHAEYEAFIQTEDFVLPNVTFCNNMPDEVHYNPYVINYTTIVSLENNNEIKWKCHGNDSSKTISVSTNDGLTWESVTSTTSGVTITTLNRGDRLLIKGTNSNYASSGDDYSYFATSDKFTLEGNIMSMFYGDNFSDKTELSSDYALACLFLNCNNLLNAENLLLPATTLTFACYSSMFKGCTSLTTAPELPATTLSNGCYSYMFNHCTSLTTAPELPATTLGNYCYSGMFQNCTSLTDTPSLPATTLADYCYVSMFYGCTSLTTVPTLPATTLTNHCYQEMFQNCTSLTTAPELPATTLTDYCYNQMFQGCTKLNYVKCLATNISASGCTSNWLRDVKRNGTFVKDASMTTWLRNETGIPSTWTVEDYQE